MINRQLLCHSCTVQTVTLDEDREETVTDTYELSAIRIHRELDRVSDSNGFTAVMTATLWYDCEQSKPAGFVPLINQKVSTADGSSWTIKGVKPHYATADKVEFYEAVLA